MFWHNWIEVLIFFGIIFLIAPPFGYYMASIFSGKKTLMHAPFGWIEKLSYQITGIDPAQEMTWNIYLKNILFFNFWGFFILFSLLMFQEHLPLNPQHFEGLKWPLAFNIAISFVTNTNWQSYAGETTLSYFSQMAGLTVQNFASAATGSATALALIRGIMSKEASSVGNFFVDLTRAIVYIFLPLSVILALILLGEGTIQNFSPYLEIETIEGIKQTIPGGPVASQVAIKQIGTNGGGFFNTNSAHPFENPSSLSNWLQMIALLLIPAATIYCYGLMTGFKKHSWILFGVMLTLFASGLSLSFYFQYLPNNETHPFPLLEGIETRFGITNSLIWSLGTTATSNGSVNAMLSSLSPISGGISLFNIMLGELIFGGVGVGLCSIIMFCLLTVFLSGLMVGRTPEYMGKKIGTQEMQWVVVSILLPGALILIGAGISAANQEALSSLSSQGPHGLSEILYAFSSAAGNNGSAFAGLNANTNYYNIFLGLIMLTARLAIIVPSLCLAGLLLKKNPSPPSLGTFSISSLLFFMMLLSIILIVGALTFFPALSLGPIVEHFLMLEGQTF